MFLRKYLNWKGVSHKIFANRKLLFEQKNHRATARLLIESQPSSNKLTKYIIYD
jgi:hypothetical protein